MSENEISKVAENFISSLDYAKERLDNFSRRMNSNSETISLELLNFEKEVNEQKRIIDSSDPNNKINDNILHMVDAIGAAVHQWKQNIELDKEGKKFMEEHEKYMVVMVFGAVKTGKSYLGNFIAGKYWLDTEFDNVYKQLPKVKFSTQEKGRDTGAIIEENGREWFKEGETDTTGDIQFFTLSGLRWFDSPGTGALGLPGDKKNMEELVEKYLKFVDLCVFLINSSEPGTMGDLKYINKLSRAEQEAIVVLTRSDMKNEIADKELNKLVSVYPEYKAKDEERRHEQEESLSKYILDKYDKIGEERFKAMSISTAVAKCAMKKNDYDVFSTSNLQVFMGKIADKAKSDVIELKERRPKKLFNQFIDEIIHGNEKTKGIDQIREYIVPIEDEILEFKKDIDGKIKRLTTNIIRKVRNKVELIIEDLGKEAEEQGRKIGKGEIQNRIHNEINPMIISELSNEINMMIDKSIVEVIFSIFFD